MALVGCLELLVALYGERRGVATWVTAGVVGTATGPVAGGLLAQAISWEAIFVVQVPFAVLAVPAALTVRAVPVLEPDRHRPAVRPNLTLALLSAALTAALFLLVLLLVEGWRHSPAIAALTVSVVPVAALAARPLARLLRAWAEVEVAVGCFLIAGGLVALAILPSAHLGLDYRASGTGGPRARVDHRPSDRPGDGDAAAASGARGVDDWRSPHRRSRGTGDPDAGVHRGHLRDAETPAQEAITSLVLDAPMAPQDKIAVAQALGRELSAEQGRY